MSRLSEVGDRAAWRCWLCDKPVDQTVSSNDSRGATIDNIFAATKGSRSKAGDERLAHLGCNTKRGAVKPVIGWPDHLIVADPAVILTTVERLQRKGGREIVGRTMDRRDAQEIADWLLDRISRLAPELKLESGIEAGGGQYMVSLSAQRR